MDGIFSCCGEERVMVFTMNSKDNVGACLLRPGRIDVHINFPLCDFTAFKSLASSHLGLKDHKIVSASGGDLPNGGDSEPGRDLRDHDIESGFTEPGVENRHHGIAN
ncbi:UNVERIFIED_CONTAM: AAA-ATPase [Sesamum latifolium]|uniref:AAA-ATPase n=1 Tax=Sesamum latifolium TaxID=2727402 RepID=A0AAW2SFS6_9LAMI